MVLICKALYVVKFLVHLSKMFRSGWPMYFNPWMEVFFKNSSVISEVLCCWLAEFGGEEERNTLLHILYDKRSDDGLKHNRLGTIFICRTINVTKFLNDKKCYYWHNSSSRHDRFCVKWFSVMGIATKVVMDDPIRRILLAAVKQTTRSCTV